MTSKCCKKCNVWKPLHDFHKHPTSRDGHINQCIQCKKEYLKQYTIQNKDVLKQRSKEYYETNQENIKKRVRAHWNKNAIDINTKRRERYKNDQEYRLKLQAKDAIYNMNVRNAKRKERRKHDESWRIIQVCRTRLWNALNGRAVKTAKTIELLGCTGEELKEYLEKTKIPGKDYTNVHIDHIIPCSSFDFTKESEQRKCFHYTNLQYLPAEENIRKGSKIPGQ